MAYLICNNCVMLIDLLLIWWLFVYHWFCEWQTKLRIIFDIVTKWAIVTNLLFVNTRNKVNSKIIFRNAYCKMKIGFHCERVICYRSISFTQKKNEHQHECLYVLECHVMLSRWRMAFLIDSFETGNHTSHSHFQMEMFVYVWKLVYKKSTDANIQPNGEHSTEQKYIPLSKLKLVKLHSQFFLPLSLVW